MELRVAVLGLGLGTQRALGYLQNPSVQLCAVCDIDAQKVDKFLAEHPEVVGYNDFKTMLKRERPNMINISTPDWMHVDHAMIALKYECHVLVENPMVTELDDAEKLIRTVERTGLKLMVGQHYRRTAMAILAKQLLANNTLGTIFHASAESYENKFYQFTKSPWYTSREHPYSPLLGTGIHGVDMLRWLIGEVEEVCAYGNHKAYADFPEDDFVTAIYKFKSGAIGRVDVSYACTMPRGVEGFNLRLYGNEGSLENDRFFIVGSQTGRWEGRTMPPLKNPLWQESDYFAKCIVKDETPDVDVREGARNVAACLAGVEAAKTGKPVIPARF